MNSQSGEIDSAPEDPQLYTIVRQSFRVPVDDPSRFWVRIDDKQYPLRDICLEGIGITLENPAGFVIAQTVMDCELCVDEHRFHHLNGRVVHFSLNSGRQWQCGIQWIAIDKKTAAGIGSIVETLKAALLQDDSDSEA